MNFESTGSHLLNRNDIINILSERHLKIQNIELMGYEELLRIYETFAQPLEKRNSRRSPEIIAANHPSPPEQPMNSPFPKVLHINESANYDILQRSPGCTDSPPTKYLKLSFNTITSVAKKRSNGVLSTVAQECTPPKRKPITWP